MRLTKIEVQTLLGVANETLAGSWENLKDAYGMTDKEADRAWKALETAVQKLALKLRC